MNLIVAVVISLIGIVPVCAGTEIIIQAEDMQGNVSNITPRRHASEQNAVHLFAGDSLQFEMCFISNTKFTVNEIGYSNDGPTDRIQLYLDNAVIDEFWTVENYDGGRRWDSFETHQSVTATASKGNHILKLEVLSSDRYGVEIDYLKLNVFFSQGQKSLKCDKSDMKYSYNDPVMSPSGRARAVQRSVVTRCAEEDNINIPIFHDNASSLNFQVTASSPKYHTLRNNRGPDWTSCKMIGALWRYQDVNLVKDLDRQSGLSSMQITKVSLFEDKTFYFIEIDFELEGPSTGSINSEIGTLTSLKNIQSEGSLKVEFQYYNRYNVWSTKQVKTVNNWVRNIMFETPDFSFREGKGNRIRIEFHTDLDSPNYITIGDMHMYKRNLRPDTSKGLYNDGVTIIEGVDIDMWWRINETMSVTIKGKQETFNNVDYLRIYQPVPLSKNRFSEVFVLYQDANVRLLHTTPQGFDWIPFGSSVIIGQTDPQAYRPCAPISHLDIDPVSLQMTIFFKDSNTVNLEIQTTMSETQLHVSNTHYVKDLSKFPFFTFRSMYVADGNSDVDHISADSGKPKKIIEQWGELRGNFFSFYRQFISKHNTQSPDISIKIS